MSLLTPAEENALFNTLSDLTFDDTCNSWRRSTDKDPVTKEDVPQLSQVLEDRKCGLDRDPSALQRGENIQKVEYDAILHIDTEADFAPGDKVEVTLANGAVEIYIAGEQMPYADHLEVQLTRDRKVA
jgi:hypothetical protein